MPTKYRWHKVISNTYLGQTRVIRGATKTEVEAKVRQQLTIWAQREAQQRARQQAQLSRQVQQDYLQALEAQTESNSREAQARLATLRQLLPQNLQSGNRFQWNQLKQNQQYPPFQFSEVPPTYQQVALSLNVPAPQPIIEGLFSSRKHKREELEAQARSRYTMLMAQFEARRQSAFQTYEQKRQAYERVRDEYNASVDERQRRFEQGDAEVMTWFLQRTLDQLDLPEDYGKDFDVAFDGASGIGIVNMQLPTLEELPKISGYRFIKTRKTSEPIELKQKDIEALYDSLIYQIALLTIHRIFRESYSPALQSVVFNGWVTGIDPKTGNDYTSCILSVQASRATFQALNLERVDAKECVKSLKGLVAGPLAQLAPVKPIMDLNREDSRFVESRNILESLDASDNLATMDWEDFEHLVRELFSRVFGGEGTEVRVTQASRDRGVDAIAFDPDPIRGGKFVIQAKRYNNVVPVSAVRELFGIMGDEGAVKGILVTTSHYGNEAREFAKDKPLTLIDGANLIQMFQEYGYNVKIEIQKS